MATISEIQQLYIAYFGRPADPAGLDYWVSTGISTKDFAAAMYAQPEFQQVNAGLSVSQQVNALYVNLFGREADVEGLTYWTQQINTGKLTLASIANDLIYAANNSTAPQSVIDKAALDNKTATALTYTSDVRESSVSFLAYNPTSTNPWVTGPQFASANAFLDTATATNAPDAAAVQASVNAMTAITPPGQTFTLTTNPDTFGSATSSSPQTFNGSLIGSLSAFDQLTGGTSGQDSLSANLTDTNTAGGIIVTGVENVTINTTGAGFTFNTASNGFSGVTNFTLNDTAQVAGAIAVDTAGRVTINAQGGTTGTITVGATTAATGALSITAASAGSNSATSGAITTTGGTNVTIAVTGTNTSGTGSFTEGNISVTGTAATTSANVSQSSVTAATAVTGVTESASVVFNSAAMAAGDTMSFAGLTYTSTGATSTAQAAAAFSNLANGAITGAGTATGTYSGLFTGYTTGAVTSGTTVVFTSTTANTPVADLTTAVDDQGGAGTVSAAAITVTQGVAAVTGVVGVVAGAVDVLDANRTSLTAAGTITTVTYNGFGAATANSNALTTVNLAGLGTSYTQTQGALTTATVTTNTLNLSGVTTTGTVNVGTVPTTVTVNSNTATNTLNALSAASATTVNIAGSAKLVLTGQTFAATAAIVSTSTGAVTLGSDIGTTQSYVGSTGVDTISVAAAGTKAITTGGGNDVVTYGGALSTGGSIDAGDGTGDTISMTAANAATATGSTTFAGTVAGFEILSLSAATGGATTINMANADGMNQLTIAGSTVGTLAITNAANNFTLTQRAASTAATTVAYALNTGADVLNIAMNAAIGFQNTSSLTANLIETVNITTDDTNTTANAPDSVMGLTLAGDTFNTINISGDNGLQLINTSATLTTVNAGGLTGLGGVGGLTFTTGALANSATITGGAAGTNNIVFTAANTAAKTVTYVGGSGIDNVTGSNGLANTINLGNGVNSYTHTNAGVQSVTGGTGIDTIITGTGNDVIFGGGGNDVINSGTGLDQITGGAGADLIAMVANSASSIYANVLDFAVGDQLTAADQGTELSINGGTTLGAAQTLAGTATFTDYLNVSSAGNGSTNGIWAWFQFSGNTYVVEDRSSNATFTAGTDLVIQLTGTLALANTTGVTTNTLTFV